MTLGTNDKKKVGFLAVLGLVAVYMFYTNVLAGPSVPSAPREAAAASVPRASVAAPLIAPVADTPATPSKSVRSPINRNRSEEFHPVLHSRRPEDRIDPMAVDPTLRMDLLKKVQEVELAGGSRNLFQFGTPPPPKDVPKMEGKSPIVNPKPVDTAKATAPAAPVEPPPPPITLKFYGYSAARPSGMKTAYFLDGDDILMATEGETLKRRYKVIKINPNSVLLEDINAKRQQSVPLTEEAQS